MVQDHTGAESSLGPYPGNVTEDTLCGLDTIQHALESGQYVLSTSDGEQQFGIPSVERIRQYESLGNGTMRAHGPDGRTIRWYEGEAMARRGEVWWTIVHGDVELLEQWIGYNREGLLSQLRTVRHQLADILYPALETER